MTGHEIGTAERAAKPGNSESNVNILWSEPTYFQLAEVGA